MTGRVVAVANMKGGVGKTTSSIMLAEGLALAGPPPGGRPARVLLIDTDPQVSLGYALLGFERLARLVEDHHHVSATMTRSMMLGEAPNFAGMVVGPIPRTYATSGAKAANADLSLLACSPHMIHTERLIVRDLSKQGFGYQDIRRRFRSFVDDELLAHAREAYDWVVVDCAPGLNMLTHACLLGADATLVVTVPEPLSLFGLEVFLTFQGSEGDVPRSTLAPLVLRTRVKANQRSHALTMERLRRPSPTMPPYTLLETVVPEMAALDGGNFVSTSPMSLRERYGTKLANVVGSLADEIRSIVHEQ